GLGVLYNLITQLWGFAQTFGVHNTQVRYTHEAEHHTQVAFLMFHGLALLRFGVDATTAQNQVNRFFASQTFRAIAGVAESARSLSQTVHPGFELARNGEVVERSEEHTSELQSREK